MLSVPALHVEQFDIVEDHDMALTPSESHPPAPKPIRERSHASTCPPLPDDLQRLLQPLAQIAHGHTDRVAALVCRVEHLAVDVEALYTIDTVSRLVRTPRAGCPTR